MNRQQQIDVFLLKAHQLALTRLRDHSERLRDVPDQLMRWRLQDGRTRSDPYWQEWSDLLADGVDAVEWEVCGPGDHAVVLRNVSPMAVLISQHERSELLRAARRLP